MGADESSSPRVGILREFIREPVRSGGMDRRPGGEGVRWLRLSPPLWRCTLGSPWRGGGGMRCRGCSKRQLEEFVEGGRGGGEDLGGEGWRKVVGGEVLGVGGGEDLVGGRGIIR